MRGFEWLDPEFLGCLLSLANCGDTQPDDGPDRPRPEPQSAKSASYPRCKLHILFTNAQLVHTGNRDVSGGVWFATPCLETRPSIRGNVLRRSTSFFDSAKMSRLAGFGCDLRQIVHSHFSSSSSSIINGHFVTINCFTAIDVNFHCLHDLE